MEPLKIDRNLNWLKMVSQPVDILNDNLKDDIKILEDFCLSHKVLAMAAIQLGIDKRIIYIKNTNLAKIEDDKWNEGTVLVNPVIVKREGLTQFWEACASCLDNMGLVLRPYKVLIKYFDLKGKKHQKTFKDFAATVFSHEYDHLDGILHMDRAIDLKVMNEEERKIFRKTHPYEIFFTDGDFEKLEKEHLRMKESIKKEK